RWVRSSRPASGRQAAGELERGRLLRSSRLVAWAWRVPRRPPEVAEKRLPRVVAVPAPAWRRAAPMTRVGGAAPKAEAAGPGDWPVGALGLPADERPVEVKFGPLSEPGSSLLERALPGP